MILCHLTVSCFKSIIWVIIQSSSTPGVHSLRKLKQENEQLLC